MTTKNFFTVSAIVAIAFGLGLLFAPETIIPPYMVDGAISDSMKLLGMAYGSSLIGLAIMFWMGRNASSSVARKAIISGTVVSDVSVGLVHIYGMFTGVETTMTWGTVVLVFLLAIWGISCLVKENLSEA